MSDSAIKSTQASTISSHKLILSPRVIHYTKGAHAVDPDCPLVKVATSLVEQISEIVVYTTPGAPALLKELYGITDFQIECPIEVYFFASREDFAECHYDTPDSLGLFAITASGLDDSEYYSSVFRVSVCLDRNEFDQHMKEEREAEFDPSSNRYDVEHITAYLTTITHEVAHVVRFAKNSIGLSPEHIGGAVEDEIIDNVIEDFATGRGIMSHMPADMSDEEAIEVMEDEVEERGRSWCRQALSSLDPELINQLSGAVPRPPQYEESNCTP